MYATAVGLVIKGFELSDSKKVRDHLEQQGNKPKAVKPGGIFDALFAKTRNFFDEDNDRNS